MKKFLLAFALSLGLSTQSTFSTFEPTAPYGKNAYDALTAFIADMNSHSIFMRPVLYLKHFPIAVICGGMMGTGFTIAREIAFKNDPNFQGLSTKQQKAIIYTLRTVYITALTCLVTYAARNYTAQEALFYIPNLVPSA